MSTDRRGSSPRTDQHVGDWLSGYIDGELTQQQRQTVLLHCERCDSCQQDLDDLIQLRSRIGSTPLSTIGEDKWRENMDDPEVKTARSLGWILFISALVALSVVVVTAFLVADDMHIGMKLILVGVYGGLAALLYSVGRQRLIERKTDKYKDVEI